MQLRALLAHRLLQRLQRYHRHTQRADRCHNHTNAGMQPVTNGRQNRSISLAAEPRELARLLGERLLGRLWRPRQVLFVANADDRTGSETCCEMHSGWDWVVVQRLRTSKE